jgi:predicted Zn-dependent protease
MENGFAEESIRQFKHCISTNEMFLPAWEALAQAYERIGETERAEKTRQTSAELEEVLSWRRVEADVRSHRPLWKSKYIY